MEPEREPETPEEGEGSLPAAATVSSAPDPPVTEAETFVLLLEKKINRYADETGFREAYEEDLDADNEEAVDETWARRAAGTQEELLLS